MRLHFFIVTSLVAVALPARAITPEQTEFFEKKIRPVLVEQCYKCHGPEKQKAALRMDSRDAILKGTDVGPIVGNANPEETDFIKSLRHTGNSNMPEKADKLPEDQIVAMAEWVKMGMPWPEHKGPVTASAAELARQHWSYQPMKQPTVPTVADTTHWGQSPVDNFILAGLEKNKIAPSPRADKRTLLRRVTYDLTGLPPTVAEVTDFEKDDAPEAFAKVVDRLLASPSYGERWGRYWLDIARYADTKGYLAGDVSRIYPFAYTYRDWVINALNEDLPYDQFITQQLAGDRIATPENSQPMAAMGFLTVGRRFLGNQADIMDDRIDTVTRGLMGITVACARCHDHKFDPISAKDYYALYGVFASSVEPAAQDLPILKTAQDTAEYVAKAAGFQKEIADYFERMRAFYAWRTLPVLGVPLVVPGENIEKFFDQSAKLALIQFRNKLEKLNDSDIAPPRPMAMVDTPQPYNPRVFLRGNPGRPGEAVPRRFLEILSKGKPEPFTHGSGRLDLARAIASKDNPLTARVLVNRVWSYHFGGLGLVRTPGDFGVKGEAPTHPELLDYLALRFVEQGWSQKQLHRTILLTSVYQQSSNARPEVVQADPENRLVHRMNRRRLDFEAMRDSLLSASGQLDSTVGGRAVELTTPPFAKRRTVYGYIDRQNLPGIFRTFDFASPDTTSPQRHRTTVPQQALFMMNSPFVTEQARAVVAKPEFTQPQAYEAQVQELYESVLTRKAVPSEVDAGLSFVMNAITKPAPFEDPAPVWQYGYGSYDEAAKSVKFTPLKAFVKNVWQGGAKLPDANLGHVSLFDEGGHPGRDAQHDAVRRWTASKDGVIEITGALRRPGKDGDGVIGRVVSSRMGELWKAEVAGEGKADLSLTKIEVKAGETIDFLVGCRVGDNTDTFLWAPLVRTENEQWDAKGLFAGPKSARPPRLEPWAQYAQVLLMTNEFMFVD